MQDNNDSNAGTAGFDSSVNTDQVSQGGDSNLNSGTPDNQNGTPTNQGNEEVNKYRREVQRLNQALIDAKRGNRNNGQQTQEGNPFETPEGQYGIAIQVATGNLRGKIEDIFSLYPEIPAEEIARIRKNPWAFSSHDSFVNGNWESAALEIEESLLKRAEELSATNSNNTQNNPIPANLNNNPVQSTGDEPVEAEEDDWTMPIDQLEAKAKKAIAKVSQSKK